MSNEADTCRKYVLPRLINAGWDNEPHSFTEQQTFTGDRKNYTKTQPIQFEEFADCVRWWSKCQENDRAWKAPAKDVLRYGEDGSLQSVNLDLKNPRRKEDITHLPPEQLAESIPKKEPRIAEIMTEIQALPANGMDK